jgi:hypothetical protein
MKKQNVFLLAIAGMASLFSIAHAQTGYNSGTPDCSNFSTMEQQFSSQLTPSNMQMFCGKFNQPQRNAAMQMAGQTDAVGNVMTQDQAVQKVAQDNNMMPSQQKNQSGCPMQQ